MAEGILATNCITCNRRVEYQEVLTDVEGKQGRWLAKVSTSFIFVTIRK